MANFRDASRQDWASGSTNEDINAGSLQRIADATEKMAASYDAMRNDRDRYERWYKEERARCEKRDRQISALRGVITRLKRREGA